MKEHVVREQLVILVASLEKLKGQVNRYRHERNVAREQLEKQVASKDEVQTYRAELRDARDLLDSRDKDNESLRSELLASKQREKELTTELGTSKATIKKLQKELKRLVKLERIHDIEQRSSPTRGHLNPHSASLELKVLSMLQSTRKRMTEFNDSA